MITARDALKNSKTRLSHAGVDTPLLDAEILLAFVLRVNRIQLHISPEMEVSVREQAELDVLLKRRGGREPIAYIIGVQEFWSLDFIVTPATLIPRPDSETLVEAVLSDLKAEAQLSGDMRIIDLGTGSGCLLLSLLSTCKAATGVGVDQSAGAIAVATENANTHGLDDRVALKTASWFDDGFVKNVDGPFDIIISNAPYIPKADIDELEPDVKDFEPLSALDGGEDGLDDVRHIINLAPKMASDVMRLYLEIGMGQGDEVATLLKNAGYKKVRIDKDLAGIGRIVSGLFKKSDD